MLIISRTKDLHRSQSGLIVPPRRQKKTQAAAGSVTTAVTSSATTAAAAKDSLCHDVTHHVTRRAKRESSDIEKTKRWNRVSLAESDKFLSALDLGMDLLCIFCCCNFNCINLIPDSDTYVPSLLHSLPNSLGPATCYFFSMTISSGLLDELISIVETKPNKIFIMNTHAYVFVGLLFSISLFS